MFLDLFFASVWKGVAWVGVAVGIEGVLGMRSVRAVAISSTDFDALDGNAKRKAKTRVAKKIIIFSF
jgi:hypothetical protein